MIKSKLGFYNFEPLYENANYELMPKTRSFCPNKQFFDLLKGFLLAFLLLLIPRGLSSMAFEAKGQKR